MVQHYRWAVIGLVVAFPCVLAFGTPAQLSRGEIAGAVKTDAMTVPTPGELLAAINKQGKPNWQSQYRPPVPTNFSSRPQLALNLGGLIADGYIAVEAEDRQQVKNIAHDVVALAKALGVSQNVLSRGSSISEFAENEEWSALKEELEATQNEVKTAMDEQHDGELITIVSLGGWIRGTEVISTWVSQNYTAEAARLLRQPALVAFLRSKLAGFPAKTQDDPLIASVRKHLETIEQLVTFPRDKPPDLDHVNRLKADASELVAEISSKPAK